MHHGRASAEILLTSRRHATNRWLPVIQIERDIAAKHLEIGDLSCMEEGQRGNNAKKHPLSQVKPVNPR
jgi:hypothetical protein